MGRFTGTHGQIIQDLRNGTLWAGIRFEQKEARMDSDSHFFGQNITELDTILLEWQMQNASFLHLTKKE